MKMVNMWELPGYTVRFQAMPQMDLLSKEGLPLIKAYDEWLRSKGYVRIGRQMILPGTH